MKPVLVAGVVGIDHIIMEESETTDLLGGSLPFAAMAAARFGKGVQAYGVIGEDFPQEFSEAFRANNVATDYLEIASGKTFRWCGKYERNMNNRTTVSRDLNVLEGWEPALPAELAASPVVILASATSVMHLQVLNQCTNPRLVLADTIDHWILAQREETDEVVSRSDIFVLNESEAELYSGSDNLLDAGEYILDKGAKFTIIKMGCHGSMLFHRNQGGRLELFRCAAWPLRTLVDPTGAGDAFLGALGGYLASLDKEEVSFEDMKTGMAWGSVAASFVCEDFSAKKLERTDKTAFLSRFALFHELTSW